MLLSVRIALNVKNNFCKDNLTDSRYSNVGFQTVFASHHGKTIGTEYFTLKPKTRKKGHDTLLSTADALCLHPVHQFSWRFRSSYSINDMQWKTAHEEDAFPISFFFPILLNLFIIWVK